MIKQSLAFNDILEKKYKILRTSIILGNLRNKEETLNEYEETAKEIDKMKTSVYEELLAAKMYTTSTLEDEMSRLRDLISFIENRINERNDFVDDYIKITSNFLDGLDKVSLENDLSSYKTRYNNIEEYLNNCREIREINLRLRELKNELEEKYETKANNELINSKLEDELIDEFNRFVSMNKYYSELNYADIDLELSKIDESLLEKKSVLDTFMSSYNALVNAGISGAEREEYASYVSDAKINYYEDIEKKYILNIYKLVLDKQLDYDKLYNKRINIESILNDRNTMREELYISKRDELEYFIRLCKEQLSIIKAQKFDVDNIDKLILEISSCEDKLNSLENANNRFEIVEILNEFSEDAPEIEKIDLPDEDKIYEEVYQVAEKTISKKPSNMVVKIKDPIKINVKSVTDTAKLVMKKVVIVLEPKKFGNQRDKLKEAELELAKEKNKLEDEKLETANVSDISDLSEDNTESLFNTELEDEMPVLDEFVENNDDKVKIDVVKNEDVTNDNEVISTIEDVHDIFLDDDPDEIGIQLDTKKVEDKSVTETKELTEIKINASDPSNMMIPTEIFIEDPPKEEFDLFKSTDPFLDDNEFELNDGISSDEIRVMMPSLGRIGTVKPNNALSKIESVVSENNDVVLPNLGLVDGTKGEVPIVSENYIS